MGVGVGVGGGGGKGRALATCCMPLPITHAHAPPLEQDFTLTWLAGDAPGQLAALSAARALPTFGAHHFLLAAQAAQGRGLEPGGGGDDSQAQQQLQLHQQQQQGEVARAALAGALARLATQTPLDCAAVAPVGGCGRVVVTVHTGAGSHCCCPHGPSPLSSRCCGVALLPCTHTRAGTTAPPPPPPQHTHLQVLRALLGLAPGDSERLALLGEARGLLGAAPLGAYPQQVHKGGVLGGMRGVIRGGCSVPGTPSLPTHPPTRPPPSTAAARSCAGW